MIKVKKKERWAKYEHKKWYRRNSKISEQVKGENKINNDEIIQMKRRIKIREELEQWQKNCWRGNDTEKRTTKEEYL